MFEKQELEAERRKLAKERAEFEAEKQRLREMLALPLYQRAPELLTVHEVADQLNRMDLIAKRVNFNMWNAAIALDQGRQYGKEYTT